MTDLELFFVGTAGSVPSARRGLPGIVIRRGGDKLLFDCGEGTQRELVRTIGLPDFDAIFITHFHADHWLGLPGMLKTFDLRGRETPLRVYGPHGLISLMDEMSTIYGRLNYPCEFVDLDAGLPVRFKEYSVTAFPVEHRGEAYGYVLLEDDRLGQFDAERAESLGVKSGPDFGRLQRGETVNGVAPSDVMGEPRRGRKIVLSGDTRPCETVREAASGADVLVHEATFLHEEQERAIQTKHSTAHEAAEVGQAADVELLLLTHITARYLGRDVRKEAQTVFARAKLAHDFDTIEIPFPERGKPHLIGWPERSQLQLEEDETV